MSATEYSRRLSSHYLWGLGPWDHKSLYMQFFLSRTTAAREGGLGVGVCVVMLTILVPR